MDLDFAGIRVTCFLCLFVCAHDAPVHIIRVRNSLYCRNILKRQLGLSGMGAISGQVRIAPLISHVFDIVQGEKQGYWGHSCTMYIVYYTWTW